MLYTIRNSLPLHWLSNNGKILSYNKGFWTWIINNSLTVNWIEKNIEIASFISMHFYWQNRNSFEAKFVLKHWLFSRSVVSNSLPSHGLKHARPPCLSPSPRACSSSCPLSRWCHPTISSSVVPFSPCLIFASIRVFSNESALHIRWPKYWSFSFSISPSNEYSGLISFRMDWFDLLAVQETLKNILQHHSSKASILQHSALVSFFFLIIFCHRFLS